MRRFTKILLCVAMVIGLGGLTTVSADASTSRKLTASYSTKTPLTKSSVTVHGAINHSAKGTTVTVQRKSGKKWKTAKSTKTTTSAGAYSVKVTMSSSRGSYSYRAYVAKKSHLKSATSSSTKISVRSLQKVSLTPSHSTIGKGSAVTLSGAVSPFKKKAKVTLQKGTSTTGPWSTYKTLTLSSKGKYSYSTKPSTTTYYRVSSPTQSSSYLAAGTSSAKKVTVLPQPVINTSIPNGVNGDAYSTQLTTTTPLRPGTWAKSGTWPSWLSLSSAGHLTATHVPTSITSSGNFSVRFTDAAVPSMTKTQALSFAVYQVAPAPHISTSSLPGGTGGTFYTQQLQVTGTPGTWTKLSGSLPTGLTLSNAGLISGTPTVIGTSSFTVMYTQSGVGGLTDTAALTITIVPAAPAPTINTSTLPHGALASTYGQQLDGSAGIWSILSGSLPAGVTMSSGGLITGTPTTKTPLTASFTVRLTSGSLHTDQPLLIVIDPFIATTGFPAGTVGVPYSFQLQRNGTDTGTWSSIFSGQFGLTLHANGLIDGIPTSAVSGVGLNGFWPITFTPTASGYAPEELDQNFTIEGSMPAGPAHTTISAGGQSACRIKSTDSTGAGTLWCWGANGNGQVDPAAAGASSHFTSPNQIGTDATWTMVSSGSFQHTCAVNAGHDLYCFGYNFSGQIGTGVQPATLTQGKVAGTDWRYVSAGRDHTCAIQTDNSLWCWGQTSAIGVVTAHPELPTQVGGAGWTMVSAGSGHTCGLQVDATLWCWGSNGSGAVGNGTTTDVPAPTQIGSAHWLTVSAGNGFVCAVKDDLTLWCWGSNGAGQQGNGSTGSPVTAPTQVGSDNHWLKVSAGGSNAAGYACAIKADGTAWCWGANGDGQLGIGNTIEQHSPTQIDATTSWSSISAGGSTTCAVKNDESQRCWGSNGTLGIGQLGELGNGTSTGGGSAFPVTVSN